MRKINEVKLKEIFKLTPKEFNAVKAWVSEMMASEETVNAILNYCNGTLSLTRKWLESRLDSPEEIANCIAFFERNSGYCECEILYNVVPFFERYEAEIYD